MTVDQRARRAGASVHEELADLGIPDPGTLVRRGRRRRRTTTGLAALVVVAAVGLGLVAARDDGAGPDQPLVPPPVEPGWVSIPKTEAGLEEGSSYDELVSDGDTALLAGAVPADGWWEAAIWWTEDGGSWQRARLPDAIPGWTLAVALDDGVALAAVQEGPRDDDGGTNVVLRSEDDGRSWTEVARGDDLLGPAAPEMGRPFASEIVRHGDWWVAAGGSSTGYAGIWVSADGAEWEQVLESDAAGGVDLVHADDGRLVAHTGDLAWITDDPTSWGEPIDVESPDDRTPSVVADGGHLAIGQSSVRHEVNQLLTGLLPLFAYGVEEQFDRTVADPMLASVARFGALDVVTGADEEQRPTAWTRVDDGPWAPMPPSVRGAPGGVLGLTAQVGGRVVALGTAPEFDRYFAFGPPSGALDGGEPTPSEDVAAMEDEARAGSADVPSLEWLRIQGGIPDFDPARAVIGVGLLGEVAPFLPPLVRQNIPMLDPAAFGVTSTDDIRVAVGAYRGEPGQFQGPDGEALQQDGVLLVEALGGTGVQSRSIIDASTFAGIEDVLEAG